MRRWIDKGAEPRFLLGVLDGAALERRVMRLMDARMPWAARWRAVSAAGCVAGMLAASLGVGMLSVRAVLAQGVDEPYVPTMTFDVASVRQSPPLKQGEWMRVSGRFEDNSTSLQLTNNDLMNLLIQAYGVQRYQLIGVPNWQRAVFNVQAKGDAAEDARMAKLSKKQQTLEQQHMMQGLLAERFKLKAHWETRVGDTFDVVVSKPGRMPASTGAGPSEAEKKIFGERRIPALYQRGSSMESFDFVAHGASMEDMVEMMSGQFGHPVNDKTGLKGKYDFVLKYHDTWEKDRKPEDTSTIQPLDVAIQEQLGLKLVPTKGPVKMLVIDSVEKPGEN